MNKLYIIGNGFDRFHDLPTGYYNYAQWLEETGSEVLDEIHETFGDCDSNWWSGFEQNLASINTIEYASNIAQEHVPDFASDEFRDRDWYEAEYAVEEKLSEIYFKNISPSTTLLYSDASMLPRSTQAASQISFSKPIFAVVFSFAIIFLLSFRTLLFRNYMTTRRNKVSADYTQPISFTKRQASSNLCLFRIHNIAHIAFQNIANAKHYVH